MDARGPVVARVQHLVAGGVERRLGRAPLEHDDRAVGQPAAGGEPL